jgi:hypothetical protein
MFKDIEAANFVIYFLIAAIILLIVGSVYRILSLEKDLEDCFVAGSEILEDKDRYLGIIGAMCSDMKRLIKAGDNLLDENEYAISADQADDWGKVAREIEAKL